MAHLVPLSIGFSRQEYWSRVQFPAPGDLSDPGIESASLSLLHWQEDSLPVVIPGKSMIAEYKRETKKTIYMCEAESLCCAVLNQLYFNKEAK